MKRGLAISTVLLLLAAIWIPLASADEVPDYEFLPDLGDELSAYGQGYVENLMLWSGAGIHLKWGPSFMGDQGALDARLAELVADAGGPMPTNTTPLVVPFSDVTPAFAAPAPIDHSEHWSWNTTGVEARVNLGGVAATITAETDLAARLMEGDTLDAEGLHMVLSALEAARFMNERLGWNGSDLGPINMSDPNMTDTNASNGWWLPAFQVMGLMNGTTGAWEDEVVETENTLDGSMMALRGLLALGDYLSGSDFLVGTDKPFPAGTDTEVLSLASAVFNNIVAIYYDVGTDLFLEDDEAKTGSIAYAYFAMIEFSETGDMVEYWRGWAEHRAMRLSDLLVHLQAEDGTLALGVSTAIGGTPESYIPPYMQMPGVASHVAHTLAAAALFDASGRFGGMAYASAAKACLAADDANHWLDGEGIYVQSLLAETTMAHTGDQLAAIVALTAAVELGDVDLARYRIAQVWGGIVTAQLQLSETDAHGENYTIAEPDTNNNTIWKHDWDKNLGTEHGNGPVLASSATMDAATGNWTIDNDGRVNTYGLMMAALIFMGMDGDWFDAMGGPEVTEEHAYMLLHWTPEQWMEYSEDLNTQVTNLTERVEELEDIIDNGTGIVDELLAQIASLEENLTAMHKDLNESLENETILRNQTEWLRQKMEETNETVDDLMAQISVLESQVDRLEERVVWKDENITKLEEQLRSERHNVTQLQWELDNASSALSDAEKDLKAAEKRLEDTEEELDDLQSRMMLVAVAALVAGMIIVVLILRARGKI